ncbi:MAG TPA: nuclear transport factor 2 family protein [Sphingomonas sp.]|nr:nuclear transport factor 2 family protein [Sphingomonas sp.]
MAGSELLQSALDRQAISDQLYRYCRAMDRIDVELGYSIWHEDGTADYGEAVYVGSGRGFIDHVCAQHRHCLKHSHQMTNIIIELDGERAASESYVFAALRVARGEQLQQMMVWSRYIDRWSRRGERWAIDHRIAIQDFGEVREIQALGKDERGRRDRDDPSYSLLR